MRDRVKVFGTRAIVTLVSGTKGEPGTGLILQGPEQCFDLAAALIEAGDRIAENRRCAKVPSGPGFFTSSRKHREK